MACIACGLIGVSIQLASSDELDSTMSQVLNAVIGDSPTSADKAALQSELQSVQQQAASSSGDGSGTSTGSTAAIAARTDGITLKSCQGNLRYLDAQLPRFTDPTLMSLRDQILIQSVPEYMQNVKAQGYDMPHALAELHDEEASADRSSEEGKQCAIATSVGDSADAPWKNWNSSNTHALQCGGVRASCMCAYVAGRYTSIALHAMEAQISTCWN